MTLCRVAQQEWRACEDQTYTMLPWVGGAQGRRRPSSLGGPRKHALMGPQRHSSSTIGSGSFSLPVCFPLLFELLHKWGTGRLPNDSIPKTKMLKMCLMQESLLTDVSGTPRLCPCASAACSDGLCVLIWMQTKQPDHTRPQEKCLTVNVSQR